MYNIEYTQFIYRARFVCIYDVSINDHSSAHSYLKYDFKYYTWVIRTQFKYTYIIPKLIPIWYAK